MELTKSDYLSIQILLTLTNSGRYGNWKYRIVQPKKGKIYQLLFLYNFWFCLWLLHFLTKLSLRSLFVHFFLKRIIWFFSLPNRKYESEGETSSDPNIGTIDHLISLYFFHSTFHKNSLAIILTIGIGQDPLWETLTFRLFSLYLSLPVISNICYDGEAY